MVTLSRTAGHTAASLDAMLPARSLLSAIVDSSADAIVSTTLSGIITSWNRAAEQSFGYKAEEIVGRSILLLIPPHLHREEVYIMERVQKGEPIEHFESIRSRRDGSTLPVAITISPIRSDDGTIVGASKILRDVSGRDHRQEIAHLLAAIVESSDDAIMSKNLTGTITSWNRAAEVMFGYTGSEIIGKSVLTLIPPELHHEEPDALARLERGERIEHHETVRMAKDGRRIDVSVTISPIRNAHGVVVGASKVVRDIAERKKSDVVARHLAAIVESSDDAIVSKNLDGIIQSWNGSARRMFGYEEWEIVGQPVLRLIPPELQYEEPAILARLRRGERIDHYETQRVRKDGTRFEVSLTISPIKDVKGRVIGVSKIVRDISAQRKADEATRLLAAIVDSSDDAIVSKNLQGVVTSWNAGAQRVFGYTAEEMVGTPISRLFPVDRLNEEPMILERLKRGERVDHYQTIRVRKDGAFIHVSLTISPIKNAQGRIVGASKIARDITREIHAMEQLAKANEELTRADRMKSEFLAVMSHELRTPLNSIIGFTGVIRQGRQGPVTEDQKKLLNLISASGKHLLHLINDLLDLSRIEAGRMDLEYETVNMADVIDDAVRTLELQASMKELKVHQSIELTEPVVTDPKRVFQVILNLLNNAIKFTPQGSVTLRAYQQNDLVVVSVTDTGIGIPKEKQSALFQAFSQVEGSSRRRFEGTGLGLYLCKKMIELLGGTIAMESEAGRGSTFTFSIPTTAPHSSGAQPQASA